MVEYGKRAIVHMESEKLDMNLILPIILSPEQEARIVMPPQSAYRMKVLDRGRVTVPKAIRDALRIAAGDEVDIIIMPVRGVQE